MYMCVAVFVCVCMGMRMYILIRSFVQGYAGAIDIEYRYFAACAAIALYLAQVDAT